MSRPYFPDNAFTDKVPRRGATSHKAGPDQYRRLDKLQRGVGQAVSNDVDELNMYRTLGSSVLTYNFDPGHLSSTTLNSSALLDANAFFEAVYLPNGATATGLVYYVETAGVGTWTTAKVGIYDAGGTRLAVSSNDTALCKATGVIQKAFSSTVVLEKGLYYLAIMIDWSAVSTSPKLGARIPFDSALTNLLCPAAYPRTARFTGQTDLSASYTLSSGTLTASQRWMALY